MLKRCFKGLPAGLAIFLICGRALAQATAQIQEVTPAVTPDDAPAGTSIFSQTGQAGRWISQFFPFENPNLDGIHAAVGKMLAIYNTGILVLAGMLALWAIVTFIIDTAHHGTIGGKRHSALYGPLRLVIALGLLVPLASGYNGAQIVSLKLAQAGSGLANSIWREFSPSATSLNFSRSSFAAGNVDAFLQQALIDEACFAAIKLGETDGQGSSVKIQAIYEDSSGQKQDVEGAEIPLSSNASMAGMDSYAAYGAIATESRMTGHIARQIRIHYNRIGNDDYCGSLTLPVPVVPEDAHLEPESQTAYTAAYLAIRPDLATYAQKVAAAIDAAVKAKAAAAAPPPAAAEAQESQAYLPPEEMPASPTPQQTPAAQKAYQPVEVPHIELPVDSWDALIEKFNGSLLSATDKMQEDYINPEVQQGYSEGSDADWVWAGSLFFKLTKLSHDDLKLRYGTVSAELPNPEILPAEMRSDGVLATCPDLRSDIFLPDYHCRPEGKETTLIVKTAHDIIHTVESQRSGDALPAIDAGPTANRKGDVLSGNLIAAARLDAVVAALADSADSSGVGRDSKTSDDRFEAVFGAVNIGNALYLSSSSLFHASALAGANGNNGVSSFVLSLFAVLVLVPGFFLAVYLPLLPALRFFLGMVTWLVTIFEALVSLPLIALIQLRTEGEGLLVQGRQGFFLLLQMLLRPALMIFGLMAAIIIFEALYGFITWAIWTGLLHVSADTTQFGNGIEGMVELLGYLFFWSLLVYFAANLSFNAITTIPDRILVWIGAADIGSFGQVGSNGGSTQQIAGGGTAAILGGTPQMPILPGAPASALVTGGPGGAAYQIGQFGGPAGTGSAVSGQGTMANGAHSPNAGHFPSTPEKQLPEGPVPPPSSTTIVTNPDGSQPKVIPGRPRDMPRQQGDFSPNIPGGEK